MLSWPVNKPRVTSKFGTRIDPTSGKAGQFHTGVDIISTLGVNVPVLAAAAGKVVRVDVPGAGGGYGYQVIIDHGLMDGVQTFTQYAHLDGKPNGQRVEDSTICVRRGQVVAAGERIANMGTTGLSTGVHLHFEVRLHSHLAASGGGTVVDPLKYIKS